MLSKHDYALLPWPQGAGVVNQIYSAPNGNAVLLLSARYLFYVRLEE